MTDSIFQIEFLRSGADDCLTRREGAAIGKITIGSFSEKFESALSYWSREKYMSQWTRALLQVISSESRSALITSMTDPVTANFLTWWPMYKISGAVFIQNQILFMDQIGRRFDPDKAHEFVGEHFSVDSDGEKLSEWSVPIEVIEAFLNQNPGKA